MFVQPLSVILRSRSDEESVPRSCLKEGMPITGRMRRILRFAQNDRVRVLAIRRLLSF